MQILRLFSLSLAFLLLSCQTDKIPLRFNTKGTTPVRYSLESQMKLILQGAALQSDTGTPQALGSRLSAVVSSTPIVSYDDGTARFQLQADSVSYRSDQRSVEECAHIEKSLNMQDFQYKMGSNGEMQDLRMNEFVPDLERTDIDLRRLMLKIQPVLPGTPVSVGESWERQQVFTEGSGQQSFVYKWFQVEDVFERDGKTMAKLRMNIKYKLDDSTSTSLRLKGNDFILGSGDVLFNVTDGVIDDGTLEINGSLNVLSAQKSDDTLPDMQVRQTIHLRRLG